MLNNLRAVALDAAELRAPLEPEGYDHRVAVFHPVFGLPLRDPLNSSADVDSVHSHCFLRLGIDWGVVD